MPYGWPMPNSVPMPPIAYQQAPTTNGHYNHAIFLPPNQFPQMQTTSRQYHQIAPPTPTQYTYILESLPQGMPNLQASIQYSQLPMGSSQYQMIVSTFLAIPTTMYTSP